MTDPGAALREAAAQLREATAAGKCHPCGCLSGALRAIQQALPVAERGDELDAACRAASATLQPEQYDCLGCPVCFPALALSALQPVAGDRLAPEQCAAAPVAAREGWPPLPGDYRALDFTGPVAICTLTDRKLADQLADLRPAAVAIIGTLFTENLGIERLITNLVANPNIRFLILCGPDSLQAIGHLPGKSLAALKANGCDEKQRIIGAPGRRPVLRNLPAPLLQRFLHHIELIDLTDCLIPETILAAAQNAARHNPGPLAPLSDFPGPKLLDGILPERMIPDPAGYFVIYTDPAAHRLRLEHYDNQGTLLHGVNGKSAAELYTPVIAEGWITRLDHAAYLGRELARAESALREGHPFIQDGAPERAEISVLKSCC